MFRRLLAIFKPGRNAKAIDFPSIPRAEISHLLVTDENLPHLDWQMATAWLAHREPVESLRPDLRRAICAAWLDELRDAVQTDSRRWRRGGVEGLAPLEGTTASRLADWSDRSLSVIHSALSQIRGDEPIPPIAVIGLGTHDEYYSFVSHFYENEGEFATSGGLFIRSDGDSFPLLVIDAQTKHDLEATVAHELTHHALAGMNLPLWAEEGLTQMMEERVTGHTPFAVTREMLNRHRGLWLEEGFNALMDGSGFHSPEGEVQELSYHMAQMMTRSLLTTHPKRFFAFARACASNPSQLAAREHLGAPPEQVAEALLQ